MLKGALPESTIKLTFGVVCMKIVAALAKGKKGKRDKEKERERGSKKNEEITLNINNFHTATNKKHNDYVIKASPRVHVHPSRSSSARRMKKGVNLWHERVVAVKG